MIQIKRRGSGSRMFFDVKMRCDEQKRRQAQVARALTGKEVIVS